MKSGQWRWAGRCCRLVGALAVLAVVSPASAQLVVSAANGNGGNASTGPKADFVEIFNRSCAAVNLEEYSIQVADSSSTTWTVIPLPLFRLQAGQYYSVRIESPFSTGFDVNADLLLSLSSPMLSSGGKVAIVRGFTSLSGDCPAATNTLIDFVKFRSPSGAVACTEGLPADLTGATISNGKGVERLSGGCQDTNINRNDFFVPAGATATAPRTTSTPLNVCSPQVEPNWGGCELQSGNCVAMTEAECDTAGGAYNGDCSACLPSGACCDVNGGCRLTTQDNCDTGAGENFSIGVGCNFSYAVSQIPVNFEDISGTGTTATGASGTDDGSTGSISIGFAFSYFNTNYSSCFINSNGWLSFVSPSGTTYQNLNIPNTTTPNGVVAGLWDDLNSSSTGTVKYQTLGAPGSQVFIVQWTGVPQHNGGTPFGANTFEIKLFEGSNRIEFHYTVVDLEDGTDTYAGTSVGIENNAGTAGIQALGPVADTRANVQALIANGQALQFGLVSVTCSSAPCCFYNPRSCSTLLSGDCIAQGGVPGPAGSDCNNYSCPGACCKPDGTCAVLTQAACDALTPVAGIFRGDQSCPPSQACGGPGACCAADGSCSILTEAACTATNGVRWTSGATCTTNLCRGACCTPAGDCTLEFPPGTPGGIGCEAPRSYAGDGTNCTNPTICQGRCCLTDGTCILTGTDNCQAPNVFAGIGTNCSGPNDPVCMGRCCDPQGGCSVTTIAGCAQGSTFLLGLDCSNTSVVTFPVSLFMQDPDAGGTAVSDVQVVAGFTNLISDLDVDLQGVHTFVGDIRFTIEHNGTSVVIYDRPGVPVGTYGCGTDDFDVVLDDEGAGGPIEDVCNSTAPSAQSPPNFVPNNPLSAFDGMDPNGPWTITGVDLEPLSTDVGTLLRWSLHISTPGDVCPATGCGCRGDLNGDTQVNGKDIAQFAACVVSGGGAGCACADVNNAGGVTTADIPAMISALLSGSCAP